MMNLLKRLSRTSTPEDSDFSRAVVNHSPDCIKLLDAGGRILWINDQGRRLMELCDTSSIVGQSWVEFWPESHRDLAAHAIQTALSGNTARFTGTCPTARGTVKWWDVVVTPLGEPAGGMNRLISISRDVTDYVAVSAERDELLKRERQVRLQLEKSTREQDYALLSAAHELGGPTYAVRGWAELLRSGDIGPAELMEGIEAIDLNAARQYEVVERLLQVARARCGQTSIQLVPNAVAAILGNAFDAVMPAARAKRISMEADLSTDAWTMADFDQLQRALCNVLFNAVKFTPDGGSIEIHCDTTDSGEIHIVIADTGVGIPAEYVSQVFDEFRQAPQPHGSNLGVGAGLSMTRSILNAHHGTVSAVSRGAGLGSTFTITLPVALPSSSSPAGFPGRPVSYA